MIGKSARPQTELAALWAEYKELTSRRLPQRAGQFVRSRRFDRLLLAYALYSCVVLGVVAICLIAGAELLEQVPGWSTSPELAPAAIAPARLP
ncbi:MAG: hypothetical protein ACREH6_11510 [Geminicoccaceae bacterium]